ncbi:MAG TPA: DUF952 domain-containing protein [Pseudonocardiaceae bacterium]
MATDPIYHIALRAEWSAAQPAGVYEMSTRGVTLAQEGFIHCSQLHQVRGVADSFYGDLDGLDDLVLLTIDPELLSAPVRFEPPAPGLEDFPHIYGPLPVDAVVDVRPIPRDADGRFELPD